MHVEDGARFAERGILLILCFGTLATLLFAAANQLVPRQEPLSFALVLLVYDLAFYAAFIAPALVALALAGRALRAPRLPRIGLALVSLSLLALCLVADRKALAAVFHLGGPARFRWLVPVAYATGAAVLASVGSIANRGLPISRLLAASTLAAALIAFWPTSKAMAPPASPAPAMAASDPSSRFALIGLDGADWRYMEPLIARGELPHIAALRERGAWGPLKTFQPTKSPVIWTTIATGRPPSVHGIRNFTSPHLRGVFDSLPRVRYPAHFGFDHLFTELRRMTLLYDGPVESGARRAPAYWELATAAGLPVDVVNWWVTWPAEPATVRGARRGSPSRAARRTMR